MGLPDMGMLRKFLLISSMGSFFGAKAAEDSRLVKAKGLYKELLPRFPMCIFTVNMKMYNRLVFG